MKMSSNSNKKPKLWPTNDKLCVHVQCIPRSFARSLIYFSIFPQFVAMHCKIWCLHIVLNDWNQFSIGFSRALYAQWIRDIWDCIFFFCCCSPAYFHPAFWLRHLSFRRGIFLFTFLCCSSLPNRFAFVRRTKLDSFIYRITGEWNAYLQSSVLRF